ncbi:hypothetical protein BVG19_g5454 [[Candida] boidinii]|nr:hypothetical protein BVG19_g5454 [[Candida] boidinii]
MSSPQISSTSGSHLSPPPGSAPLSPQITSGSVNSADSRDSQESSTSSLNSVQSEISNDSSIKSFLENTVSNLDAIDKKIVRLPQFKDDTEFLECLTRLNKNNNLTELNNLQGKLMVDLSDENYRYEVIIENQRGSTVFGVQKYSDKILMHKLDPSKFQTLSGSRITSLNLYPLAGIDWKWSWDSWHALMISDVDQQGWLYSSIHFGGKKWKGFGTLGSFVRRRIWIRLREKLPKKQIIASNYSGFSNSTDNYLQSRNYANSTDELKHLSKIIHVSGRLDTSEDKNYKRKKNMLASNDKSKNFKTSTSKTSSSKLKATSSSKLKATSSSKLKATSSSKLKATSSSKLKATSSSNNKDSSSPSTTVTPSVLVDSATSNSDDTIYDMQPPQIITSDDIESSITTNLNADLKNLALSNIRVTPEISFTEAEEEFKIQQFGIEVSRKMHLLRYGKIDRLVVSDLIEFLINLNNNQLELLKDNYEAHHKQKSSWLFKLIDTIKFDESKNQFISKFSERLNKSGNTDDLTSSEPDPDNLILLNDILLICEKIVKGNNKYQR